MHNASVISAHSAADSISWALLIYILIPGLDLLRLFGRACIGDVEVVWDEGEWDERIQEAAA